MTPGLRPVLAGLVAAGLVSIAAAAATGSTAATSATAATGESERPEVPGLVPVDGGSDDVPTITAGRYVDVLPAPGELLVYSYERTEPSSVLRFGASLLAEAPPGARLRVFTAAVVGDRVTRCGGVVAQRDLTTEAMPVVSYGGMSLPNREVCREAEVMRVGVGLGTSGPVPDPGTPFELAVREAPLPANAEALRPNVSTPVTRRTVEPVAPEEVSVAVEPGPSRQEASPVPSQKGFHADLPVGEVSWFAVPVGVNRVLAVDALVADPEGAAPGARVELALVSPEGGFVDRPDDDGPAAPGTRAFESGGSSRATLGPEPVRARAQTSSVAPSEYRFVSPNTFTPGPTAGGAEALMSEPGTYTVAVWVEDVADGAADGATVPVTLTVDTPPERGPSFTEPTYDGAAPEPLPDPVSDVEPTPYDPAGAADPQAGQEPGQAAGGAWVVAALVAIPVALLVVGVVVAVVLVRRRRRGRAPASWGPGRPPGRRPGPSDPPTPHTQVRRGPLPGRRGWEPDPGPRPGERPGEGPEDRR